MMTDQGAKGRGKRSGRKRAEAGSDAPSPADSKDTEPATTAEAHPQEDERKKDKERAFMPEVLESTIIAIPLLDKLQEKGGPDELYDIIIDLNLEYPGGRDLARQLVRKLIGDIIRERGIPVGEQGVYGS